MGLLPYRQDLVNSPPPLHALAAQRSAPAVLLTLSGWIVGDLLDAYGRVSDRLASERKLVISTAEGYREVDRDEIVMVVPPPACPRPDLFVAKQPAPVVVDLAGIATVTGNCHVLPGSTVWDVWQRSPSGFAGITDANLRFPDGHVESAEVVLVSRHAAITGLRIS